VELQIRDLWTTHPRQPVSIAVHCQGGALEVRVEPWASLGAEGVRSIDLPAVGGSDPAAQEARARELALALAEVVRRLELTHPPGSPPTPSRPAPPPAPPPAPAASAPGRWQLGLLGELEHFNGGQTLWGADVLVGARVGRFVLGELRAGFRRGEDLDAPWVRVTASAATASAAVGLNLWSGRQRVGLALMARAQGYLFEFQSDPAGPSNAGTARALAFVLATEPRIFVAVTRHLSLAMGAAAGTTVHGILLELQGTVSRSLTGLFLSANLGVVFAF
jgi:hypothetical protein